MTRKIRNYECKCGWRYNISYTKIREGRSIHCPNCLAVPEMLDVKKRYITEELKRTGKVGRLEGTTAGCDDGVVNIIIGMKYERTQLENSLNTKVQNSQ
jgi:hypothetical protein